VVAPCELGHSLGRIFDDLESLALMNLDG
jgi:hypothetical protein